MHGIEEGLLDKLCEASGLLYVHTINKYNQLVLNKAFSQAVDKVLEESKTGVTLEDIASWAESYPGKMDKIREKADVD